MQLMTESVVTERDHLVDDAESQAYFERHFTDAQPNAWAEDFLYGSDPKFVMAITAKVNMVLHGDGSAHIYKWDALTQLGSLGDARLRSVADAQRSVPVSSYAPPVSESFDLVVSNPPFGITLAEATRNGISRNFSLPPTVNSEALFLERWFQLLRSGGRLAVVVPESLLNTQDAGDSRLLLYRMFKIKAVVSLPRNLFPETPTLTSLLFAQKKSAAEIAVWDAAWAAANAATTQVVSEARATLTTRGGRSASDIERDFTLSVASLMQDETQLTCKGRAPITLALPAEMTDAIEAAAFYRRFLGSAGFRLLVHRRIFAQVASSAGYDFPAYAVSEVGFKLSKRGELKRSNQLMRMIGQQTDREEPNLHLANESLSVEIDPTNPRRVLDFIRRDVRWD